MIGALAGFLVGLGVLGFIATLLPRRPDLASLASRLHPTLTADPDLPVGRRRSLGEVLAGRLVNRPNGLTVPTRDLAILGRTTEEFLVQKVLFAVLGLFLFTFIGVSLTVAGAALPGGGATVTILALVAAVLLFFVPDLIYRSQAAEARDDFRYAFGSYIDLVALERAADAAAGQALVRAAAVGRGWAFTRIGGALSQAQLAGAPPWTGLNQLATDLGIDEVRELADVVGLANDNSVAIYESLKSLAATLRSREQAAASATANSNTETMTAPSTLTLVGFMLFILYPTFLLLQ